MLRSGPDRSWGSSEGGGSGRVCARGQGGGSSRLLLLLLDGGEGAALAELPLLSA